MWAQNLAGAELKLRALASIGINIEIDRTSESKYASTPFDFKRDRARMALMLVL